MMYVPAAKVPVVEIMPDEEIAKWFVPAICTKVTGPLF